MNKPIVSVCTITYMQEKYIAETIEGVLMQEVDFPIEFIIADDCSPDNTEKVVQHYVDNHPRGHWIKYTKHKKNQGMNPNFVWALNQCRGKYIAICEGDDYWTDPKKLQKQVDFLENNSGYEACITNAYIYYENTGEKSIHGKKRQLEYNIEDVIKRGGGFFITATLLFRNINIPNTFFENNFSGDRALVLLIANKGKVKRLKDITAIYRRHDKGVYSSVIGHKKKLAEIRFLNILLLLRFNKYTSYKYSFLISSTAHNLSVLTLKEMICFKYFKIKYLILLRYLKLGNFFN